MKKQHVRERVYVNLSMSIFEGSLEEVSEKVLNIKKIVEDTYGPVRTGLWKYDKYEIDLDIEWDYDNSSNTVIALYGHREETDKEIQEREAAIIKRKEAVKKQKAAKEKREITLYENLKKKYDKKGI